MGYANKIKHFLFNCLWHSLASIQKMIWVWSSCISRIPYEFIICFREFPMNSIFVFANKHRIYYLFRVLVMDPLICSCIYFEFSISFANSQRIHNVFVISFWIYYLFREFTMDSLFVRELTLNSLSLSRIH